MKLNTFLDGLSIIRAHYRDPDGFHLGADHDIIYAYPTDFPLSEFEFQRMVTLGWHQPDGDEDKKVYFPDEGWAAYV